MESYPSDLMAGVVPLVFAVNAILAPAASVKKEEGEGGGGDDEKNDVNDANSVSVGEDDQSRVEEGEEKQGLNEDEDHQAAGCGSTEESDNSRNDEKGETAQEEEEEGKEEVQQNSPIRGPFDRFLDAIAGVVADDEAITDSNSSNDDAQDTRSDPLSSLLTNPNNDGTEASLTPSDRFSTSSHRNSNSSSLPRPSMGRSNSIVKAGGAGGISMLMEALDSSSHGSNLRTHMAASNSTNTPTAASDFFSGSDSSGDEGYDSSTPNSPVRANKISRKNIIGNSIMSGLRKNKGNDNKSNQQGDAADGVSFIHAKNGRSFFQRARIVPVSKRHAFPPSKDPTGTLAIQKMQRHADIANGLAINKTYNANEGLESKSTHGNYSQGNDSASTGSKSRHGKDTPRSAPATDTTTKTNNGTLVEGILSADWLDKHVNALPSVVLVVTLVDLSISPEQQTARDTELGSIVDQLRSSIAAKRECRLHLVCLITNHDKLQLKQKFQAESNQLASIRQKCRLATNATTLLHIPNDLGYTTSSGNYFTTMNAASASTALKQLHRTIRNWSMSYYLTAARRVKRKMGALQGNSVVTTNHNHTLPSTHSAGAINHFLLPLTIRYQFKVGIFYEFQGKIEKSLKYFQDAYNNVELYYRFILSQQHIDLNQPATQPAAITSPMATYGEKEEDSGVEVSLVLPPPNTDTKNVSPPPAGSKAASLLGSDKDSSHDNLSDMAHQCRAVADWLNFKLLKTAFSSIAHNSDTNTAPKPGSGGLMAIASQWRRHSQVFLTYPHTDSNKITNHMYMLQPLWHHYKYSSHQRLVISQLAERYPHKKDMSGGSNGRYGVVLMQCCAWTHYAAAAESIVKCGVEANREAKKATHKSNNTEGEEDEKSEYDNNQVRASHFLGGLESATLENMLKLEMEKNHSAMALEYITRALSLFQSERTGLSTTDTTNSNNKKSKSLARLYYLAGTILYRTKQYAEAAHHLEIALSQSCAWPEFELSIGKIRINCLMQSPPPSSSSATTAGDIALSLLFRNDINRLMSPIEIHNLHDLAFFGKVPSSVPPNQSYVQSGLITWPSTSLNTAPFTFSLSFPNSTHGTAGDAVEACLVLKSHLPIPITAKGVQLLSSDGNVDVDVGKHGILVLDSYKVLYLKAYIPLPAQIQQKSSVSTGTGASTSTESTGKQQSTTATGAKIVKLRTGGLTRAGGAYFIPQTKDSNKEALGGKPISCHGLVLTLIPCTNPDGTQQDASASSSCKPIKLTLSAVPPHGAYGSKDPSKQSKTTSNIKDEENYIMSAWSRPSHHDFRLGPRCMRVIAPVPYLSIENLTFAQTRGMAMDGTVNRIVLKLKAGDIERCNDLKLAVVCSNSSPEPSGKKEVQQEKNDATHIARRPIMIIRDDSLKEQVVTDDGYLLPLGWKPRGSNGMGSLKEYFPIVSTLNPDEATLIHLDFFRPLAWTPAACQDSFFYDSCKSDYEVVFTYKQTRHYSRTQVGTLKNENRNMGGDDEVTCRHHGSLLWAAPLSARFSIVQGTQKSLPCGSRHPKNMLEGKVAPFESAGEPHTDVGAAIDGETIVVRCTLESLNACNGLVADINDVTFEKCSAGSQANSQCDISLVTTTPQGSTHRENSLYTPLSGGADRFLREESKIGISYSVRASLKTPDEEKKHDDGGSDQFFMSPPLNLGVISVVWKPVPLSLSNEVTQTDQDSTDNVAPQSMLHGPLVLSEPLTLKFFGPACQIERVPFEAVLTSFPYSPRVAQPFEVKYSIANKTCLQQKLTVAMSDSNATTQGPDHSANGVLVSGLVSGEFSLAPFESTTLGYSALATKAGKTPLPSLTVASNRYHSWVIHDGPSPHHFLVLP